MARLDKIDDLAKQFVLLEIGSMRGVNLDIFEFNYDLTWMVFFLNAQEKVYGRYGGRPPESVKGYLTLAGLRHAMTAALKTHKSDPAAKPKPPLPVSPRRPEQLPAAQKLSAKSCIHCHHVWEFRRDDLQTRGLWKADEEWVYPQPENIGVTLDLKQGNRVERVAPNTAAARVGMLAGDTLVSVNGVSIESIADLQYALHRAPAQGRMALTWQRQGKRFKGKLELAAGWKKADISWRWSLRSLEPGPGVDGYDLNVDEKKALGLGPKQLAFRQGAFVPRGAQQAGIRINDVIVGVDGRKLEMNFRQFDVWMRLNYRVGNEVTYQIIRMGKRMEVKLKL